MMLRDAIVDNLRRVWGPEGQRCAELNVTICQAPDGASSFLPGMRCRAVSYENISGIPAQKERIRIEVSALAHRLGTGGHGMVMARLDILPADVPPRGHLVKTRYMPDQIMVAGVDEQDTPGHEILTRPIGDLTVENMPVIVADLHSSLPAIVAGIAAQSGALAVPHSGQQEVAFHPQRLPRLVYIMTDGAALPAVYSRTMCALRDQGYLASTITCGQAWGGDLEAVTVHNALLAARHILKADIAIVIQGPGNLGTDTPWGFSGLSCGEVINAAALLGGRPVACVRVSQADLRPRHRGVSHHSLTAYGLIAHAAADVVVPLLPGAFGQQVLAQATRLCETAGHTLITLPSDAITPALKGFEALTGISLSTMGRGLEEDEAAFVAAAASGIHAADLLDNPASSRGETPAPSQGTVD